MLRTIMSSCSRHFRVSSFMLVTSSRSDST